MKLTILERILLLQILPTEGDLITLKVIRDLQNVLGFSEADYKKYKIEQENGQITWNIEEGRKEVELKVGEKAQDIIKESFQKLDKEKKLEAKHINLYERFVK